LFRFFLLLLDGAGRGGMIPGQDALLGLWTLPTFQLLKSFMHSLSHKHVFFPEEDKLLNFIHLLFRSIHVYPPSQYCMGLPFILLNMTDIITQGVRVWVVHGWPLPSASWGNCACKHLHPLPWALLFWDSVLFLLRFT